MDRNHERRDGRERKNCGQRETRRTRKRQQMYRIHASLHTHIERENKKGERMGRGKRAFTRGIYLMCRRRTCTTEEKERRRRVRVNGAMSNDTKGERHALASSDDKKPETYKPEESVLMLCCLRLVVDCQRWDPVFLEQEVVVKIFIFHKPSRKQD